MACLARNIYTTEETAADWACDRLLKKWHTNERQAGVGKGEDGSYERGGRGVKKLWCERRKCVPEENEDEHRKTWNTERKTQATKGRKEGSIQVQ